MAKDIKPQFKWISGLCGQFKISVILNFTLFSIASAGHQAAEKSMDSYYFDSSLLRGEKLSPAIIDRFNNPQMIVPGIYKLDIYLNGQFSESTNIELKSDTENNVKPCLTSEVLTRLGVDLNKITGYDGCNAALVSKSVVDINHLRLNLSIPQSLLKRTPRGYVDPNDLDQGSTVAFINYLSNYYHAEYSGDTSNKQNSAFASLNGGINFGLWQYRQQSNINWDKVRGGEFNNLINYFQRPLPSLDSKLVLGQTFTTGQLFSGLSYTGLNLSSDERMLPDSQRGYAPTVRGVANTNAKVSIRQNGREIYQITVPPGPFEISDLYPTSYSGDLYVEVTEADGTISRFTVPYSAVPESLRPGTWRYGLSLGQTRDVGNDAPFADLTFQYGITNAITSNSGFRISDGYQATTLGGVYSNAYGAFGFDTTYSRANLPQQGDVDGWMAHLSYSRTFEPTNTAIYIAGYRYSTAGYRDLGDVLGVRDAQRRGNTWSSTTYQQQSRIEISLNQSLNKYGNIYISGSTQNYRDGRSRDTQLQAGYGNSLPNGISLNVSISKQRLGGYNSRVPAGYDQESSSLPGQVYYATDTTGRKDTITSISISFPLGSGARNSSISSTFTHSETDGAQYQTNLSGFSDQDQTVSYSAGVSHMEKQRETVWNGNIQKRLPSGSLGASASRGNEYWQASANAQGAVVAHSDGITFGPYLGETFALVEAKGAEGAHLMNGQGTVIDQNGYALVPSVTPYRYSSIALNPEGMPSDVELIDGERRVAPIAGAAVRVKFKTRGGYGLLIKATLKDSTTPPIGADALDSEGQIVGMVGQAGLVYVRVQEPGEKIQIRWGESPEESCRLNYHIPKHSTKTITRTTATCI
ncbi:fimbria/pilus outer membrane usher protein [uncultured Pseudomonas sp.]|uniref:fimbria/pilus outer membrane usher protein n=1 Tax=uncultured Pseudomonas sp. TaxID=114707 RepID=UPI0025883DFB|nr:fimbria/pilus outer membrane usher protein [uncultured Pseudomonas sp.]